MWHADLKLLVVMLCLFAPVMGGSADLNEKTKFAPPARLELARVPDFERVASLLEDEQWSEAIEILRRTIEVDGARLMKLPEPVEQTGFQRFVTVGEVCQRQLADLARTEPEAIALYRRRVDPVAERWFEQGVKQRDAVMLQRIVDQLFVSSRGDDALLQLGDMALENGEYQRARWCWERISPQLRTPSAERTWLRSEASTPIWLMLRQLDIESLADDLSTLLSEEGRQVDWLAYPDSDIPLAAVRARLVLVSILEGELERARLELALFELLHPNAQGTIAGRSDRYFVTLERLLDDRKQWPALSSRDEWPEFAGSPARQRVASQSIDPAGLPLWNDVKLPVITAGNDMIGFGRQRVSESRDGLLSYHPVIAKTGSETLVLWNEPTRLRALQLRNGTAAWPTGDSQMDNSASNKGTFFELPREETDIAFWEKRHPLHREHVGVPRFSLTVSHGRVFARMGTPRTGSRDKETDRNQNRQSRIVGFDLSKQGKTLSGFPIWPLQADDGSRWEFEGSPIVTSDRLYVALRRTTQRGALPELHVACYQLTTHAVAFAEDRNRPHPQWQVKLCAANTAAGAEWDELTHNLLTLHEGKIFCNTNLGVVAAMDALTGKVRWMRTYPRLAFRNRNPDASNLHNFRDMNPCVAYRDQIFVAPTDSELVFALDIDTGQLRWQHRLSDVVQLLGVGQGNLLAGGDALYWIDAASGERVGQFPQPALAHQNGLSRISPAGYGRGILAGEDLFWPTRERIYVFRQQTRRIPTAEGRMLWEPEGVRTIDLRSRNVSAGNLVIADGVLLIASPDALVAFDELGPRKAKDSSTAAFSPSLRRIAPRDSN